MRTSHQIKSELEAVKERLEPLLRAKSKLSSELSDALSIEFIEANGIKKDDVEMSDGFGTETAFVRWLKDNSKKKWAEWNGLIHKTDDLIAGFAPPAVGRIKHL